MTTSDSAEIAAALSALPGVTAASIEPEYGGPGVLHLGLAPDADEAAVAAAVSEVLRERFRLGVDADRVVHIEDVPADAPSEGDVPPAPEAAGNEPEPSGVGEAVEDTPIEAEPEGDPADATDAERRSVRPAIERLRVASRGLDVTVSVALGQGGHSFVGVASGAATQGGVHRAVALATLRAVEAVIGGRGRFELDHVDVAPSGQDRTALVTITLLTRSGDEKLTGAAIVRADTRQAVIRAALDAVNRRIECWLGSA